MIACSGKAGAGKDTVGSYLETKKGFVSFSFAYALKQIVSIIFDWPLDVLLANTEETRKARALLPSRTFGGEVWNYRKALQLIGTDLFRNKFCTTIWTDIVAAKIEPLLENGTNVVITDSRFVTEIDMVNEKGGFSLLLWRKESDLHVLLGEHVSEHEFLQRRDIMIPIDNTSDSKDDLFKKVDEVLVKLLV